MERPRVADGYGVQICRVAANILNKQTRIADKGRSSSLGVRRWANNSSSLDSSLLRNVKRNRVGKCELDTSGSG
jgi:hypothetical protein